MILPRKHALRACLLLLLLAAGVLCACAMKNHADAAPVQNQAAPGGRLPGAGGHISGMPDQTPGGGIPGPGGVQRQAPQHGNMPGGMPGGMPGAGGRYAPLLILYSLVFAGLCAAACVPPIRRKIRIAPEGRRALMAVAALFSAGLLLRIASAALIPGHPFDINSFRNWATTAAGNLFQFYAGARSCDYPPFYIYVLFLIGKLAAIPGVSPYFTLLLKLPSMLADLTTSYLIYRLAGKYLPPGWGIPLTTFYLFNPAVLINSAIWGQVDSFFTLIVVSSLFMLTENRIGPAAALFAAAVMMKPQGIIFLPVLGFELIRQKGFRVRVIAKALASALGAALIIMLPFSLSRGLLWIFKLFAGAVAEYPYASVNAFNLFSLLGANFTRDASTLFLLSYRSWGMIFIVATAALAWFIYHKGNNRLFAPASALLLIAGVFTLSTGMHERYLFPAVALSLLAFIHLRDSRLLLLSAGFSATTYINTHCVLFETMNGINAAPYSPALIITSLMNVLLLLYLVKVLFDIVLTKGPSSSES